MNIKQRLESDVAKYNVSGDIEGLKAVLNKYMLDLNKALQNMASISFDYCGGCFSSHGYFDFSKEYLFIIDCEKDMMSDVKIFGGINFYAEFKFHKKSGNLTYWKHSVKSVNAKSSIENLIVLVKDKIEELK